jgi:hypothetical protein
MKSDLDRKHGFDEEEDTPPPGRNGRDDDDDDTPETPLDEPLPAPIVDPPPDDRPKPPLVV